MIPRLWNFAASGTSKQWCRSALFVSSPLLLTVRGYFRPDPGTLEQRLFRAVTKPVISPVTLSPADRRIRREQEKAIRAENNPYRRFLVDRAREDFFGKASGRLLLVLQPLYHTKRELTAVRNKLFTKNLVFRGFPVPILREAAAGTRWQLFSDYFLQTSGPNLYLFGDANPTQCQHALRIIQTVPFLLLLGGVVEYRILTANQLQKYAKLSIDGDLEGAQTQLIGTLENSFRQLQNTLTRHQTDLVFGLRQLTLANETN
ncbi:Mitochondrial ribosomal protein l10 [Paragonimus westermani]|uniref:Large ribosomal subunit protein uL10m n=1 Tax=Paragonimus westermani TaxID=34504 RepID=A0A8T0DAI8_9TREM|nr:Mitochondrial ribosomal protein l10 [Paragonimus westermani]